MEESEDFEVKKPKYKSLSKAMETLIERIEGAQAACVPEEKQLATEAGYESG